MAVLDAETNAWMRRDFAALAGHWVHSPKTRRMIVSGSMGIQVDEGWDAIATRVESRLKRLQDVRYTDERLRREKVNIVIGGNMAWVSYDQVGSTASDAFELAGVRHEVKIFHRVDGTWKIGCLMVMQRSTEHSDYPLIEIDVQGRSLWMNEQARERIKDHPGLVLSAGKLRARRREHDAGLCETFGWAFEQARDDLPARTARQVRAVPLGRDNDEVPIFCWVAVHDGKALVTFDNAEMVARRIGAAEALYGLSPAQARLARLIVEGNDLSQASDSLGIGVTTARTHLQRIFERTGVHSQAALVRVLLSAEAPAD